MKKDILLFILLLFFIFIFIHFSEQSIFAGESEVSMCNNPDLPPLLEFSDGQKVVSKEDFDKRKDEIKKFFCNYFIGSFPKQIPAITGIENIATKTFPDGSHKKQIRLTFDTKNKTYLDFWLWVPKGNGPFPLILTQPYSVHMPWAEEAFARGYAVCIYPGLDNVAHHEPDYPDYEWVWHKFRDDYPEATWTEISGKAWVASRTLDFLLSGKCNIKIDKNKIGIIGQSRYAKQAMIAAAFDERIKAVVARSAGTPVASPYRFTSGNTFYETVMDFPGDWFCHRLRDFYGKENELPIDGNCLYALIAPRKLFLHTALNDEYENPWAVERAYHDGKKVYSFLGSPENIHLIYREGRHYPITKEQVKENIDWFDISFGRKKEQPGTFKEIFYFTFDWQKWRNSQNSDGLKNPFGNRTSKGQKADIVNRILWSLGKIPENINPTPQKNFFSTNESELMSHDFMAVKNTKRISVNFGDNIRGNIYFNPEINRPQPVIIWLHPFSHGVGYAERYNIQQTTTYHRLAELGFAVMAFDQCGYGLRIKEGTKFYDKYPEWSLLGKMIYDTVSAVDFIVDGKGFCDGEMPSIDRKNIYILGFSLGGMVGLYTAALDERITGVASFCGFTPLRTDTSDKPTGGIRRLWEWYGLQPRLGLFDGNESSIPYDFGDVLSLISPRNCLIVAPLKDRTADINDIAKCIDNSKAFWALKDNEKNLVFLRPDDVCRFQAQQSWIFIDWIYSLIPDMKYITFK